MSAAVVSTVFALLAAVVAVLCAGAAMRAAAQAAHSEKRLLNLRGRVIANEHAIESLERTHRKFAGTFYRERALANPEPEHEAVSNGDTVCPNWQQAQLHGPHSDFAKCECEYCEQRREERRNFRATARARVVPGKGGGGA